MSDIKLVNVQHIEEDAAALTAKHLTALLINKHPGHCAQINDLPAVIMEVACKQLRNLGFGKFEAYVLSGNPKEEMSPYEISAPKLVERRNAEEKVVVAFIPPNTKTAAEDSFGKATFEEITFNNLYKQLREEWKQETFSEMASSTYSSNFIEMIQALEEYCKKIKDINWCLFYKSISLNQYNYKNIGLSIAYLGLIPDSALLNSYNITFRIQENKRVVDTLNVNNKTIKDKLQQIEASNQLVKPVLEDLLKSYETKENHEEWVLEILRNSDLTEKLDYKEWGIADIVKELQRFEITLVEGDALKQEANADYAVLLANSAKYLNISFECDPAPTNCGAWDKIDVHLIDVSGGSEEDPYPMAETILSFKKPKKNSKTHTKKISGKNLEKLADMDGGLYKIGMRAHNEDGLVLAYTVGGRSFVIDGSEVDIEDTAQKKEVLGAISDAYFMEKINGQMAGETYYFHEGDFKFNSIDEEHPNEHIEVTVRNKKSFFVPITGLFIDLQNEIINNPYCLGTIYINGTDSDSFFSSEWKQLIERTAKSVAVELERTPEYISFISARKKYLAELEKLKNKTGVPIVIHFDEQNIIDKAEAYVSAYEKLLQAAVGQGIEQVWSILTLDCIQCVDRNNHFSFVLMTPSHPLRTAWALNKEEVIRKLMKEGMRSSDKKQSSEEVLKFLKAFKGMNLPNMINLGQWGWFVNADTISDGWLVFVPQESYGDPNYLDRVYNYLGLDSEIKRMVKLDVNQAENRISRYLLKHPYLTTLTLNIFEPGEGEDVILLLKQLYNRFKKESIFASYRNLRYKIKLISSDNNNRLGRSLDELMDASKDKKMNDFQAYITAESENSLFPKFVYSKHSLQEFEEAPEEFAANISILQQMLSADIGQVEPDEYKNLRSSFINGMQFEYVTYTNNQWDTEVDSYWKKFISTAVANEAVVQETEKQLLTMLEYYLNLSIDVEERVKKGLPCISIEMKASLKRFLYTVHQCSEWVLISDGLLGIEFLDRPSSRRERINLIDYIPAKAAGNNLQLYVSTDRVNEIESIVKPVFKELRLYVNEHAEGAVIDSLNAISGRLPLKLAQNDTAIKGAMGMALARIYLDEMYFKDQNNWLENRMIIIPVDAHDDWFAEELESTFSLRKTDIIGVIGDAKTRELNFHLIEVKWRNHFERSELHIASGLANEIKEQLHNTQKVISKKFVLEENKLIQKYTKAQELMQLLHYYIHRALRYKNMEQWHFEKAMTFIRSLDQGYTIKFVKHALVFGLNQSGVQHFKDDEVYYHIIGKNKIEEYINGAGNVFDTERFNQEEEMEEVSFRTEIFAPPQQLYPDDKEMAKQEVSASRHEADEEKQSAIERGTEDNTENDSGETETVNPGDGEEKEEQSNVFHSPEEENAKGPEDKKPEVEQKQSEQPQPSEPVAKQSEIEGLKTEVTVEVENKSSEEAKKENPAAADVILGDSKFTAQYGILGKNLSNEKIAIDLNGCFTMSVFGVQGSGKSYTLGSIIEMTVKPVSNLNKLEAPLGAVVFHYSKTETYKPEFVSITEANDDPNALLKLQQEYGVNSTAVEDVVIITPQANLEERRKEFSGVEVIPLAFNTKELRVEDWQFLMGTAENDAMYLKQLKNVIKSYRRDLTLFNIKQGIEDEDFEDRTRRLLTQRIKFVEEYIDDRIVLGSTLKPGRVVIIDLRDEFIDEDEALGLFMVMLRIFSNVKHNDERFNKLIVFDEAHKYMNNASLMKDVIEVIREMRHKGVSMLIASQNPPSVPNEVIELSNILILHKFNTPSWLKHIQKTITAAANITSTQLNKLKSGEGYVWANKSNYSAFEQEMQKINFRPRVTKHGGGTRTAVE